MLASVEKKRGRRRRGTEAHLLGRKRSTLLDPALLVLELDALLLERLLHLAVARVQLLLALLKLGLLLVDLLLEHHLHLELHLGQLGLVQGALLGHLGGRAA